MVKLLTDKGYVRRTYAMRIRAFEFLRNKESLSNQRFKFAFVRDPYDRAVSYYCYTIRVYTDRVKRGSTRRKDSIDTFSQFLHGHEQMLVNQTACNYLTGKDNDKVLVDFVGRFENLQGDFDKICDKIKLPRMILPYVNKSENRKKDDYKKYYNDKIYDFVTNIYKDDLKMFGYKF